MNFTAHVSKDFGACIFLFMYFTLYNHKMVLKLSIVHTATLFYYYNGNNKYISTYFILLTN